MNDSGVKQILIKRDKHSLNNEREGCGFGVRASRVDGGVVKCINGEFYAPLPLVTFVSPESPAHLSGLCAGDLLLSVNGESLEGLNHQTVVAMLKSCPGEMALSIVRPYKLQDEDHFSEGKSSIASGSNLSEEITSTSSCSNNYYDNNTDEIDSFTNNNNIQKYVQKACERYVNITGFMKVTTALESYIAYHIYIDNLYVCSRRFNDFKILEKCLKENFPLYSFPDVPSKKFFKLSERQITERMYRLEVFLQAACCKDDVNGSYVMKEFLKPHYELSDSENEEDVLYNCKGYNNKKKCAQKNADPQNKSCIKIILPDNNLLLMDVDPFANVSLVHNMVLDHLDLNSASASYFALFQRMPDGFDRKLTKEDLPYFIYTQGENDFKKTLENKKHSNSIGSINKSEQNSIIQKHTKSTEVYTSNIIFKKWVFSNKIESKLCKEAKMLNMIFNEWLGVGVFDDEIAHLIESDQREEALKVIRNTSPSYNSIEFPHCASDSRKRGHVIFAVSFNWLRLYPCTLNGEKEKKMVELEWEQIKNFEVKHYKIESDVHNNNKNESDEDAGIHLDNKNEEKIVEEFLLSFEQNESLRNVILSSPYSVFMLECCQKILQERTFS